jgi:hypothetical protein
MNQAAMSERAMETWKAAMEARLHAMQTQLDSQELRIAALVETHNRMQGDAQRIQAEEQRRAKEAGENLPEKHATPVQKASLIRRSADKRAEERRNG